MKGSTAMMKYVWFFIVALLAGCASSGTKVERIDAVSEVDKDYKRVMVFAVTEKEHNRSAIEAELVAELNKSDFKASRFAMSNSDIPWGDPTRLQNLVAEDARAGNYDGVLVVSLVSKQRESRYVPEQVNYQPIVTSFGPLAASTYMQTTVAPADYEETTTYALKSTLFDTDSAKPVWQLYSSTVDPTSIDSAAKDFGAVIVKALEKTLPHVKKGK
ncbi:MULTISPECIES: hypothetical protein [Marinobacter]|uniref:Lipoprotein n=1 Tax=Marinobacter xiaoshiensis TaxID=3073652 RepID=A0ABU2HG75_9GAMM|nr:MULTISPECIES: hypothetical protein [unclassified Marinobacter]MBK1874875.1 hypothetical protein [Marinobacter sp. 1-3A]MDS1310049.1 hypothetical protein [Marinobacter sp. F60267]